MIKDCIEKVVSGGSLSLSESSEVMHRIMNGELNNSQLAALLVALKSKGESAEELAGFASAMRARSLKINAPDENTIDLCGTGGDSSGTFNISTAASFVVAGAGVNVAKHGNRSVSSRSGSADVLTELGININLSPAAAEKALHEIGITFLFAPIYHPAMKHAAGVRNELGIKTIFNMLGPITNPAGTKKQMIGTFNLNASKLMAEAAFHLDMEKICFICTNDSLDEISLSGITEVHEFRRDNGITKYNITNIDFNYPSVELPELLGRSPEENAGIILSVLYRRERSAALNVVCANAAMALYSAGFSDDLSVCKSAAEESVFSGRAYSKLILLKNFGEKYS